MARLSDGRKTFGLGLAWGLLGPAMVKPAVAPRPDLGTSSGRIVGGYRVTLLMDKPALQAFLHSDFPEMADEFTLERAESDGLDLRLNVHARHLRPGGTVSGPTIFALADVALYLAILSRIGPVALAVTTNAAIDFMRKPAAGRDLIAKARLLKLGRVLAVGDVLVFSEGGTEPVARAGLTYSIPPKQG